MSVELFQEVDYELGPRQPYHMYVNDDADSSEEKTSAEICLTWAS